MHKNNKTRRYYFSCNYKDEFPNGKNDNNLVSCCQREENSYNELKHFYDSHFNETSKNKYRKEILKSMCECCNKKGNNNWRWEDYKQCVKEE